MMVEAECEVVMEMRGLFCRLKQNEEAVHHRMPDHHHARHRHHSLLLPQRNAMAPAGLSSRSECVMTRLRQRNLLYYFITTKF